MIQTFKLGSGLIDLPIALLPTAIRINYIFFIESVCADCALSLVDSISFCILVLIFINLFSSTIDGMFKIS
jgi:hypothetical protein